MKSTGDTLEALVRASAKLFADQGLRLTQTGARFVGAHGPGGRARGRVVAKGDLDFVGDLRGRSVAFDAKSCRGKSLPLKNLKRHQVALTRAAHERGALAFFLVELSEHGRYFALTWPALAPYWTKMDNPGTPQSIPLAYLAAECIEVARVGRALNLMGAIATMLGEEPRREHA